MHVNVFEWAYVIRTSDALTNTRNARHRDKVRRWILLPPSQIDNTHSVGMVLHTAAFTRRRAM